MSARWTTRWATLAVSEQDGRISLTDNNSGRNVIQPGARVASLLHQGQEMQSSRVRVADHALAIEFAEPSLTVSVRVEPREDYFIAEVVSADGTQADELRFVDWPLLLEGTDEEAFACCVLALNLQTKVAELPQPAARLRAVAYPKFGYVGARVAIVACPRAEMRLALRKAVLDAPDLPHSPLGGPWALDAPQNRGSYLFNFGNVTEDTVDRWIHLLRAIGFTQLDFHGGVSFRFGDCLPNAKMYPRGEKSLKAVIDRLHGAGILAGLHTYSFFLDKASPWITPVPDSRLAKKAVFTLAADVTPDATELPVDESTEAVSNVTGFFVRNSITLRVNDELVMFSEAAKCPPYGFRRCRRGALGTKPSAHAKGAHIEHLNECFGLLAPDGDSSLYSEVAARNAEFYNACGFDMIYLDALDGEDVPGGPEHAWHYGAKFVFELWKHLRKPAIMEMSTFHHHLWYVRSRMGAWDHPNRSHKRFIDLHVAANASCRRMFLPDHLGWWAIKTASGVQVEPTFWDDIEYLCCKCLATDTGFALMGIEPDTLDSNAAVQRLADIIKRYEDLRHSGRVPTSICKKLAVPGAEFHLEGGIETKWEIRPAVHVRHKVASLDGQSNRWSMNNPHGSQVPKIRIEALPSVLPFDASENVVLVDFTRPEDFSAPVSSEGVEANWSIDREMLKGGGPTACFAARRTIAGREPPRLTFSPTEHGVRAPREGTAAWARVEKRFESTIDLGDRQALGLWVLGDGSGAVLNVQLRSPEHISG